MTEPSSEHTYEAPSFDVLGSIAELTEGPGNIDPEQAGSTEPVK
jgi:hypothetical protein